MEAMTSAILDFNVVQVSETGSSSTMELEGFKSRIKIQNKIVSYVCASDYTQMRCC